MKNKTILKILFLSLVLSSCGLIERFKTPEQPTDSKENAANGDEVASNSEEAATESTDDLFSKTMEETNSAEAIANTDAPNNISEDVARDEELKSLEDEFSSAGPNNSIIKESENAATPQTPTEAPVLVEEALPEIKTEVEAPAYSEAGQVKTYRVQRGETLMQIAFKLYGDISKWKEIKNMNPGKISSNSSLIANTELKYSAPATPFVWNPTGTAYLIKTADTLGTISNSVYGTKKKWKAIWENNKPLIKNPNVIYAGFTLYYTNGGMANFVQPKKEQPIREIAARELAKSKINETKAGAVEEIVVAKEIKTAQVQKNKLQLDVTNQSQSATKRKMDNENELDLVNNVSLPQNEEMAPDIDEELQTL